MDKASSDKKTFLSSLKRYFELLGIYARMDFASLTRDSKFMAIAIFSDIVSNISSISGIFLLAWKFGGIGNLDRFEVLFMLAFGNIVMGFLTMMGGCNALFPSRIIGRGQWEHMFIMPLPYGVQLTVGIFRQSSDRNRNPVRGGAPSGTPPAMVVAHCPHPPAGHQYDHHDRTFVLVLKPCFLRAGTMRGNILHGNLQYGAYHDLSLIGNAQVYQVSAADDYPGRPYGMASNHDSAWESNHTGMLLSGFVCTAGIPCSDLLFQERI